MGTSLTLNLAVDYGCFICTLCHRNEELLGHPDLQEMDPIKKVNHSLVSEWEAKAKAKLLENVQREVRQSLDKILQIEIGQEHCDPDEAYVGLYMDTIQCVGAKCNEAKKISSDLSDEVQDVCFQELLIFVRRYTAEQTEALGKKAEMDEPETIHFLKTLTTCKELKQYIQATGKAIKNPLVMEMLEMLENMEASTLSLLMDIVADMAESHLKKYFKSDRRRFCLCADIEQYFPKLPYAFDEQQRVMDEAYKVIVGLYFKHLIQSSQRKLKKCWPDIGETVTEDAELLHNTISDLAPGVQQQNHILLKVAEILHCNDIDAHKITAANMQKKCHTKSEDMKRLLQWKEHDPEDKGYDTPLAQNTLNTHEELAELLNVAPDATPSTCEDDQCLIQRSVSEHFPKPSTSDQNLNRHLEHVQEAVLHELKRLRPVLEPQGLMGFLIDCYHCQTFDHLHSLLQNTTSIQNCFALMNWVLHIYQRYLPGCGSF
ncbi:exocyst complex component 3-like protein 4 [Lates japonicus]|uniref:Exocyst complex component 3-like protein 4 n=1 Tax=Lates japonicus TaxID=270547 RepID=A0AAD3QXU6_LATJO|nr:exocyst complex component 3-like protein 4 [Lates japonicus]